MSEKLARELFSQAQQLSDQLRDAGWLDSSDSFGDTKSPLDLFKTEERPLVVGLFGGTGVGKSSLLNRLAGDDIARTGVVRPTSMEITAYLHRDIHLDALPDHFDARSFSANKHTNETLADVMWVDMPDFDSTETENKEQVLQWLPHIDLLVYVVTPERYKDAEGWRMMLESGYRHAWLFVINQWDRAQPVQYADFSGLLEGAGFSLPQIFRTVCVAEHEEDQFDEMVALIRALSTHNIVTHLQERGWMQRLQRSKAQLQKHAVLVSAEGFSELTESFERRWQDFEHAAVSYLDSSFKDYSAQFSEDKTNALSSALKSLTGTASGKAIATTVANRKTAGTLWDEWLDVRCRDTVQQYHLANHEHGVPVDVFSRPDKDVTNDTADLVSRHLNLSVEAAINNPGTQSQQLIAKGASVAKTVLPLFAFLLIAWRVVDGFISGAEDRSAFVGLDFLVNGLLLAGLGWIVPVIVERVFVPSIPDSVYRALHKGLMDGLQERQQSIQLSLEKIKNDRKQYLTEVSTLLQRTGQLLDIADDAPDPIVKRVLKSIT